MKVLITGGAGYIGSTIASKFEDKGIIPVILDSLITGKKEFTKNRIFYEGDICDRKLLQKILKEHGEIFCTIHCAALAVVPESVAHPYRYYKENVCKSIELFYNLIELNQTRLIFSSSASIYDDPEGDFQVTEDTPLKANCPYASTKITIENILEDFSHAYEFKVISLRYFNPIGADPKLRSGPHIKEPTHILGNLVEVAAGRKEIMEINGVNWETRDGSAIRDYVHVWDLANAHLLTLNHFDRVFERDKNYSVINLGKEEGVTVKEFVGAFESVIGKTLVKRETEPRPGDKIGAYASSMKAKKLLNWTTELTIEQGIRDALKWDDVRQSVLGY